MRLEQFEFLLAVADNYSMKKAAEILHTSVQNVSKTIKQLEDEINFPIFVRNKYGVFLTKEGEFVYYIAQEIINNIHQLQNHYHINHSYTLNISELGHLNILTAHSMSSITTSIYDQICQKLCPGSSSLIEKDAQAINHLIESDVSSLFRYYDLIISNATLAELNQIKSQIIDYQCYCLRKDRMGISVNIHNPLARETSISIKDILSYPLILAQPDETTYSHLRVAIEGCGIKLNPSYTCNTYDTLCHMLQNSNGYVLAMCSDSPDLANTVTIPFDENIFLYHMLIFNPTLSKNAPLECILSSFKSHFKDLRPLY